MFCASCGNAVADTSRFCPVCGAPLSQQPPQPTYQNPYQQQTPPQPTYQTPPQPTYQAPYQQAPQQPVYQNPYQPVQTQGMAWYKFLIYFGLFAGAVGNFISGIMMLTGSIYDSIVRGGSKAVYALVDGLETLDIIVGLAMIVTAVLGIYARFRLSGYHKNGPAMLNAVYIAGAAIQLIYVIGWSSIAPDSIVESTITVSAYPSMFISLAMVAANSTYFKKRAHLFVNN